MVKAKGQFRIVTFHWRARVDFSMEGNEGVTDVSGGIDEEHAGFDRGEISQIFGYRRQG